MAQPGLNSTKAGTYVWWGFDPKVLIAYGSLDRIRASTLTQAKSFQDFLLPAEASPDRCEDIIPPVILKGRTVVRFAALSDERKCGVAE